MLLEIAFGMLLYLMAASGLFIRAMMTGKSINKFIQELLFYTALFVLTMLVALFLNLIGF